MLRVRSWQLIDVYKRQVYRNCKKIRLGDLGPNFTKSSCSSVILFGTIFPLAAKMPEQDVYKRQLLTLSIVLIQILQLDIKNSSIQLAHTGKMKSREGTVVDADDLMEAMIETAKETSAELGKLDGLTQEEADNIEIGRAHV